MKKYDPTADCPKCGSTYVDTTYFPATAHKGCPLYGQNYIIAQNISPIAWDTKWNGEPYDNQEVMQQGYRDRMKADEHLDRRCSRCGHAWVEDVVIDMGKAATILKPHESWVE